jgi:HEAT repeat protein
MTRRITRSILLVPCCFFVGWGAVSARTAASTGDSVDRLLALVPEGKVEDRAEIESLMSSLTAADITRLCAMLVEPGAGDDTAARMSLEAIAQWSVGGGEGADGARTALIESAVRSLGADAADDIKQFLIERLRLAGDARALPALSELLASEPLCIPAVRTLCTVGGDGACPALLTALDAASGRNRIAIIEGLQTLGCHAAAPVLLDDVDDPDPQVREAAIAALGALGGPEALQPIGVASAVAFGDWLAYNRIAAAGLRLTGRLMQGEDRALAANFYRNVIHSDATMTPMLDHLRCASLYGLAEAVGAESIGDIVVGLTGESAELRATAAEIATRLGGPEVTQALVARFAGGGTGLKADLVGILARRGDPAGWETVRGALSDDDPEVRRAAVPAVTALGGEHAAAALVEYLSTHPDDDTEPVAEALAALPEPGGSLRIAGAIPDAPPPIRVLLIDALARRRAVDQADAVMAATHDADGAVRLSAIRACGTVGSTPAASALLRLLDNDPPDEERSAIERALAAICNRVADPGQRAAAILADMRPRDERRHISLLRVLGQLGGEAAFRVLREAAHDDRETVREAVFRSFGDWPDGAAARDVLYLVKEETDTRRYVLGMRAVAHLIELAARTTPGEPDVPALLSIGRDALDACRRTEERQLIVSKIAEIHDLRTLALLEEYLDRKDLVSETARGLITVSEALLPGRWSEAGEAMKQVLAAAENPSLREDAARVAAEAEGYEGFITDWMFSGPYRVEDRTGQQVMEEVLAPERGETPDPPWKPQRPAEDEKNFWYLDLYASVGGSGNAAAYLRTFLHSELDQAAQLETGSDDGLKAWVNGEVVLNNNVLRGCKRSEDIVPVRLHAGWNEVLLKVTNNQGGWGACTRVRAADGGRAANVRVQADPPTGSR